VLEPAHSAVLLMARRPRRRSVRVCAVSNPAWRERALPRVRATHGYLFARCPSTAGPAASTMAWHQPAAAHCSSRVGLGKMPSIPGHPPVSGRCAGQRRTFVHRAVPRGLHAALYGVEGVHGRPAQHARRPACTPRFSASWRPGSPAAWLRQRWHGEAQHARRTYMQAAPPCMLAHRLANQPTQVCCATAPHANG